MRFRNVSFAVIAGAGPFADVELGIIGMPILLAIERIRWSADGVIELGGSTGASGPVSPNLVFDRHRLLLGAQVLGRRVWTTLDTGANSTGLNANFAELFPDVVAGGTKGTQELTGIAGTQAFESVSLPEVVFAIGPTAVALRPAQVTLQRLPLLGGECCIGNAGHDLLVQGRGFSIDFEAMALELR